MRAFTRQGLVTIDFAERTMRKDLFTPEALGAFAASAKTEAPSEEDLRRLPPDFYAGESSTAAGAEPLRSELEAFVRAVRREGPVVVPGTHALRVMRVADRIREELRRHRWR
jgi:predicted dehydrogenase